MAAPELVSKGKLALALGLAVFAFLMWYLFVRTVPPKSARGVLTSKTHMPGGTYVQQPVGNRSGFWTPVRIPIAECYVFEIEVEGFQERAQLALNDVASRAFEVGQPVTVSYVERGVPGIWKRAWVTGMTARD